MEFDIENWLPKETQLKILWVAIAIILLWVVVGIIKKSFGKYIDNTDARYKTRKATTFAGYFISIVILLSAFSSKLSSLTVLMGVAGVGIAFALQEVISSLAGWLAIMFREFYKVGDRVQLGGITGDVIDVGLLRTTLMETGQWVKGDLYNGRIVKIANSFVFKEPVFNYNSDFPFLWDEINIVIKYGCDYELARKLFLDVAKDVVGDYTHQSKDTWENMVMKYRIENATTQPMVTLVLTDNWVEYTIRYITDYKTRRTTRDKIFTGILNEVAKTEGKIQFASSTVEILSTPK
jgi:small-conductance mechanosensitive channel